MLIKCHSILILWQFACCNLKAVIKRDEVWMTESRPVFELARQELLLVVLRCLLPVDDLNCHHLYDRTFCKIVYLLDLQVHGKPKLQTLAADF